MKDTLNYTRITLIKLQTCSLSAENAIRRQLFPNFEYDQRSMVVGRRKLKQGFLTLIAHNMKYETFSK
jgi:hypothetical protein